MPGFTPISMYPRMWAVTGVDYPTLLTTLSRRRWPAAPACVSRARPEVGDHREHAAVVLLAGRRGRAWS